MLRIIVTAVALFVGVAAANAQDVRWSGFYTGLSAGYGWGSASTKDDMDDWCSIGNTACIKKYVGPFDFNTAGAIGGGTLGWNYQVGAMVFGLEADLGYMGVSGSRKTDSSNPAKYQTLQVDGGFYAVLGGRLGVAFDRTLIYGKGGWAYWNTDVTQTTTNPGYKTNGSGALDGYAFGGGIEHALGGGWSVKAEYMRFQFNDARGDQTSVSDDPIGHVYENTTKLGGIDTFRLGVNYRFGQ
jgi:outer membrane immunogenic protein